jgi:hypothetical protein
VATRLPRWPWILPASTAVGAVLVWTIWGSTQRGTLVGAILIGATGVLVYALALEALPRERRGVAATVGRTMIAVVLGVVAGVATLAVAGLGYYLEYRPFG